MIGPAFRPTRSIVDLDAVAHNVALLAAEVAPAELCAVVKADGYGHGAAAVAATALAAGAGRCAVALVEEAVALRDAGIDAPLLVLSEAPDAALDAAIAAGLELTVYSPRGIDGAAAAAARVGTRAEVHLKVDTGMHRVGARPDEVVALARRIAERPEVRLAALWTHLACADEPDRPATAMQLGRFSEVEAALAASGIDVPMVHLANSAGALLHPGARRDMVRCGLAIYGLSPAPGRCGANLRPAMSIVSEVAWTQRVAAGEGIGYGHHSVVERDTTVATLPVGYADGVARRLGLEGGAVLIGGRRRPILGVVTMDQLMVDCGDDDVGRGDEAVLLGRQGDEEIGADEWARRLGTISYEIVCGFGPRLPRVWDQAGGAAVVGVAGSDGSDARITSTSTSPP